MPFFAHSGSQDDRSDWQSLADHLHAVAERAAEFARPFGMEQAARMAGLFHDLGKYDPAFQRRLEGAQLRVDHSTAGAKILMDLARDANQDGSASPADVIMAQMVAYAILGHHAGLPDKHTDEAGCFTRRIDGFQDRLDPSWKGDLAPALAALFPERLMQALTSRPRHNQFDLSVVVRFLFSCLVDADYKDTEAHYAQIDGRRPDRHWTPLRELLPGFVARFDGYMARLAGKDELARMRGDILSHARGRATAAPGLFTLTVPTGGGKTLASLGFALDHALAHGHQRIIYAIPFTSIIDQAAAIFRDVLGEAHVLEHHCAIEEDGRSDQRDTRRLAESRDRLKLAMEDWAAPVVVTTNVQFFESLFAARTSRARKLHNIAGSIIILDEAQTIPRHLLQPCVRMLDCLARLFGCTIVLCTATQPALGETRPGGAPGFPDGLDLDESRELAPDPPDLARRLKRARIERAGEMTNAALVDALAVQNQALVIVNSRKHALALFREAAAAGLDGLVHLSTRQCAVHRRKLLADIRARLKMGKPCRVVATSLVEAGVDVDFPRVWRAQAGLDSIVQAAGRCNREGRNRLEDSIVTVFSAPDHPPPQEIAGLVRDMARMANDHDDDLSSLAAIEDYFKEVYWRLGSGLDEKKIVKDFCVTAEGTNFSFREVARKFLMIENEMVPVIVRYDSAARKAVDELCIETISSGSIARKLQTYVVQVPRPARDLLVKNGHVVFASPHLRSDQFAVLESDDFYKEDVGLLWEDADNLAKKNSIL